MKGPLDTRLGLVVLVLLLIVDISSTSYITLTRDGYQNVVVNIQENAGLSGCQQAIDDVKQLVQETSTSFAQGLDRPAYFGNIVIIVPNSWVNDPSCRSLIKATNTSELAWARSSRADMQITPHHPVFGSSPYSFQYGGCKVSGLPINVPSSFVTDSNDETRGRRMAREWAHYRYGVFDEGGIPDDPRHPSGYMIFQTDSSDMTPRANTCADNKIPNGEWIGDCTLTGNSSCEFVAHTNNPDIKSSLMYRPDLDNMEKFCTKENHDDSVPSKLSYHCGSLSASEVIYKHPDFTSGITPSITEITFDVIQNPFSGYHVILDMASFSKENLFQSAKSSLMQFINFVVDPVRFSIDIYNETGWYEFQLPITLDKNSKVNLLFNLKDLPWGGSGSSNKFYQALENAQKRANDGQDIIILTAVQGVIQSLPDLVTDYQEEKITVHLIHFGTSSNEYVQIANLALYGSVHFIPSFDNNQAMSSYTWATNSLQSIYSQTKTYRAKIAELLIIRESLGGKESKNGTFYVDSSASRLLISLYYLKAEDTGLEIDKFNIYQPNGLLMNISDDNIVKNGFYSLIVEPITKELLQPGLWRYEIIFDVFSSKGATRLDVFAEASNSSMIELQTWNTAIDNKAVDFNSAPIGLYAQLTQNRKPIAGANVMALVYAGFSNGTSSLVAQIPLKDEGIADVTSGDGIYSGWLSTFSNSSISYSISYLAYGVNSMAMVDNGAYDRPPTTGSVIPMSDPVSTVTQFNRYGYGPSLQLNALPSNGVDRMPPQRITDFTITSYESSSRIAVLGWTAPRDNFGTGELITNYELERTVGSGKPTPETLNFILAEATLNCTVKVPPVNEGEYVRYRIKGRDPSSNWADTSNVASLAGPPSPFKTKLSTGAIVGIAIGSTILLIIIIIIIICLCCPVEAKRKRREATRKVRGVFKSSDKKKTTNETTVQRFEPPSNSVWQSPTVNYDSSVNKRNSDVHIEPTPQVEIRQKAADPATSSTRGSERIYFGQEDIKQMKHGSRSETYSERGTEEMVKRAPSMDLQLAAILKLNSSNLSIDRLNEQETVRTTKPNEAINQKTYARPYKPNPNANRPASSGAYYNPNKAASETNLYYTDVPLRPTGPSTKSTPSNSYLSVYAEQRAEVVPQHMSAQSSLANTLREGMRNEEWQDSNSFVYNDPRYDTQSNRGASSFDPQLHPANQVGLPPAIPSMPPPLLPRSYLADDRSSNASSMSGMNQPQQMGRSPSKPSLISAV